jgi:hypothetical protein
VFRGIFRGKNVRKIGPWVTILGEILAHAYIGPFILAGIQSAGVLHKATRITELNIFALVACSIGIVSSW